MGALAHPITEWLLITPDLAQEMLTANHHNRRVRPYIVAKYAREPADEIAHFARVLASGIPDSRDDVPAILLRNYLTSTRGVWVGTLQRLETSRKAHRALYAVLHRQRISKLYTPDHFLYPAPKAA